MVGFANERNSSRVVLLLSESLNRQLLLAVQRRVKDRLSRHIAGLTVIRKPPEGGDKF